MDAVHVSSGFPPTPSRKNGINGRPFFSATAAEDSAERADVISLETSKLCRKDDRRAGCWAAPESRCCSTGFGQSARAKGVINSELENKNIDLVVGAKCREPPQSAVVVSRWTGRSRLRIRNRRCAFSPRPRRPRLFSGKAERR